MKLLLDENLPKRLKQDFAEYQIFTVREMGWNSKKNGELLDAMTSENFDVLLTFDRNLEFQQNLDKYNLRVIVLIAPINTYKVLSDLVPNIKIELQKSLKSGAVRIQK
ncbi:MAG TPA: DUF5615 family PIN-like protein [Pyrinomonadaceae bacterium]|nr:DUF5615 family PIN-like protein [Pyrinomonadaceae bacterium]